MSLKAFKYPQIDTYLDNPDAEQRLPSKSPCAGLGYKTNVGVQASYNYDFALKSTDYMNIFGVTIPVSFLSACTLSIEASISLNIFNFITQFLNFGFTDRNLKLSFILNRPFFSLGKVIFPLPAIIVVAIENGYFQIETYLYTITIPIDSTTVAFFDVWLVICANPSPPMSLINAYFVLTIMLIDIERVILNVGLGIPLSRNIGTMGTLGKDARLLLRQTIGGSIASTTWFRQRTILDISRATFVGKIGEGEAQPTPIYISDNSGNYNFYLEDDTLVTNLVLNRNKMYSFARYNDETTNPFYISDIGVNEESEAITISGDGSYNNGITGTQSFTLKFNLNFNSSEIYYYSTVEGSSMNGKLIINNNV